MIAIIYLLSFYQGVKTIKKLGKKRIFSKKYPDILIFQKQRKTLQI